MSEAEIKLEMQPDLSQSALQVVSAAAACLAGVPEPQVSACQNRAITIALDAARQFAPRFAGVPEVKWCGPQGQAPPPMTFPKDFVDRRSTISWALRSMTVGTPVDQPIFSAQARVTLHRDTLATFSNFDAPAATVISSFDDAASVSTVEMPEAIRLELGTAKSTIVYVILNQMAGFEDVILYTSIFNFSRAFAAFQTGPWRSLKETLAEHQQIFDDQSLPLLERRAIERAALALVEQAWEFTWRQPLDRIQSLMVEILSLVQSQVQK